MNINIVLLGVIVSIIFYEITQISPGGIVVPGLIVLYINEPLRIVYSIVIAIITYFVVKLISKKLIIFGKRKFAVMIILSVFISFILSLIFNFTGLSFLSISLIGYTITGLVASDMGRQGILKTLCGLVICSAFLEVIVLLSRLVA